MLIMYKCVNKSGPAYLNNVVVFRESRYDLINTDDLQLYVPKRKTQWGIVVFIGLDLSCGMDYHTVLEVLIQLIFLS